MDTRFDLFDTDQARALSTRNDNVGNKPDHALRSRGHHRDIHRLIQMPAGNAHFVQLISDMERNAIASKAIRPFRRDSRAKEAETVLCLLTNLVSVHGDVLEIGKQCKHCISKGFESFRIGKLKPIERTRKIVIVKHDALFFGRRIDELERHRTVSARSVKRIAYAA